ncbi:MAG: hypothetical protein HUU46_04990 [Candidatus Hydrogenedentes bacterium]|nr:hypothetical protein [Candidatus Hydrogenedentota bacterium]
MAPTAFQRHICRLVARTRIESGESYVGDGVAINEVVRGGRISDDIDLFHDTPQAVMSSFEADRKLLERDGCAVEVKRERPGYVEAIVRRCADNTGIQWAADNTIRFFPLVEHAEFGLTLHPVRSRHE